MLVTSAVLTKLKSDFTKTDGGIQGTNLQAKLIFQDWAKDPVLHGKPEALNKIGRAQLVALQRLNNGESLIDVSRDFVVEAGLRKIYVESIGATYAEW